MNVNHLKVLALLAGLSLLSASAFAQGYNHQGDAHGKRYHYHNGHWHGQGDVIVADLPVGVEVDALPPQYTTVVYGNIPYYYDNNRYYNRTPDGAYIVVAAPPVVVSRPGINVNVHL